MLGHDVPLTRLAAPPVISSQVVEKAAFITLTAGYTAYQSLVANDLLPRIFGGISTPLMLVFMPFLVHRFYLQVSRGHLKITAVELIYCLFLLIFTISIVSGHDRVNRNVTIVHAATLFQFIVVYICVRLLALDLTASRSTFWLSLVVTSLVVFASAGIKVIDPTSGVSEYARDYQGAALAIVISGILVIATTRSVVGRSIGYSIVFAALAINGARSELITCVPVLVVCELFLAPSKRDGMISVIPAVAVGAAASSLSYYNSADRVQSLFGGSDRSFLERLQTLQIATDTIATNPVFGAYASYPEGLYAHNVLSAWVDLGLIGFVTYVCLVSWPLVTYFAGAKRVATGPLGRGMLAMSLSLFILIVFAKAFTYKLLPVSVALHAAYVSYLQRANSRAS